MLSPQLFDCTCGGGICCRRVLWPFLSNLCLPPLLVASFAGLGLRSPRLFIMLASECDEDDSKDAGADDDDDEGGEGG